MVLLLLLIFLLLSLFIMLYLWLCVSFFIIMYIPIFSLLLLVFLLPLPSPLQICGFKYSFLIKINNLMVFLSNFWFYIFVLNIQSLVLPFPLHIFWSFFLLANLQIYAFFFIMIYNPMFLLFLCKLALLPFLLVSNLWFYIFFLFLHKWSNGLPSLLLLHLSLFPSHKKFVSLHFLSLS